MIDLKSLVPWGKRRVEESDANDRERFQSFRRKLDRVFDDFLSGRSLFSAGSADSVWPKVDVDETDRELVITAELPGVDDDDLDVNLTGDVLTIRGENRFEEDRRDGDRRVIERSYGAFSRSIRLPFEAVDDDIDATFRKGVLKIAVPKPESVRRNRRRIAIKGH